jgi:uroporphyrinogen-III synthase
MEEIVEHLGTEPLGGSRLALQLFDPAGHPSTEALRVEVGDLVEVPVYRWHLPSDPAPALRLVEAALDAEIDAMTFTSQPGVHNLFRIAEEAGLAGGLRDALNGPVVPACIGPVCAQAATEEGIERPVWPDPPRLPAMIRQIADLLAPDAVPAGEGKPTAG